LTEIQGDYDERFARVAEVLAEKLDAGLDVGASVAVYLDGQPVVDIWGGYADEARTALWERDTITNVFSTTKTMTAMCALVLADRGELDFHAPVARYWPEFKAAGKESIEVRHLLGHTSGLAGWTEPLAPEDLADWEKCTALLAAQAPWWPERTQSGYHAVTQGFLVGEVVRRISGVSLGTFFHEQVAAPLGADFHIGLSPQDDARVARLIPPSQEATVAEFSDASELALRALTNPIIGGETSWEPWWRRAEIPAANGHGNARSVAAIQSLLACRGEARGVRLLSESCADVVFQEQSNGPDLVLGLPIRFGMGYGLSSDFMPIGPRACFWGGYGGSLCYIDQDARLCVTYVMNRMAASLVGDTRGIDLVLAAATA
jgi:CubicO group peptidase (beta-lactamase class C family)